MQSAMAQSSIRDAPLGATRAEHLSMIIQAYAPCEAENPKRSIETEILVFNGTDEEVFEALTRVSGSETVCDSVRLASASLQSEYFSGRRPNAVLDSGPSAAPETPKTDPSDLSEISSIGAIDVQPNELQSLETASSETPIDSAAGDGAIEDGAPTAEAETRIQVSDATGGIPEVDAATQFEAEPGPKFEFELRPPPRKTQ